MIDGDDTLRLRIHFASGKTVDALVDDIDANVDAEDYVEQQLIGISKNAPAHKPRWTWIGDVFLYSQAIEGIEIL